MTRSPLTIYFPFFSLREKKGEKKEINERSGRALNGLLRHVNNGKSGGAENRVVVLCERVVYVCVEEKMKAISSASNTSTSTVYTSSLYIEPFLRFGGWELNFDNCVK